MSEDKDLNQEKKEAAAKAKAEALARRKAKEGQESGSKGPSEDLAKQKAAAAAKAKAAALARKKASQEAEEDARPENDDLAKKKAAAAAKAKAAAAARQKQKDTGSEADNPDKAKAAAAAKAKAAAAAKAKARSKASGTEAPAARETEDVSPNQSLLERFVRIIQTNVGEGALEEAYVNRLSKHVPTLVANPDTYYKIAEYLKFNEQLAFDYLSELHGTDFETHMEVYAHFYSYRKRHSVALKVKIDRDRPETASLTPLWKGADWPECEAYDLLGIRFTGHPGLKRILLGEEWVGYPLRKDYEPYDVEV